ncbi:MAG TPA: DUF2142 domain-containing protein [Bacteroidia bacterium]|jgi:uncharacterized membrane protein|nr:DUF2142 domain-containing protein [Bacteroidia bacterium]
MFNKLKNIKPELFFVYAAVFFSIVFTIVAPPLQVPDEINHFYKAYQLAEGKFIPNKVDNRMGGEVPNCVSEFVFPFENVATESRIVLTPHDVLTGFLVKQTKDRTQFKDFPNTSYYSVVSYLPQVVAIFVTKKLNCSLGTMYYAGRLLTLLVWVLCMYFVIKTVPIYKWLFTLICLLPMNLYIANSFSADTVSNILSFLLIALVLKHAFAENQFRLKDLLPLALVVVLLALAKVVYVGLVLSFLIIPIKNFKSKTQFFVFAGVLFVVAFAAASYWSGVVMSKYTPYVNYNPAHRDWICLTHESNLYEQKKYILSHVTYFLGVIYRSIFDHPLVYILSYIGMFGNNEILLPKWLTALAYVPLLFIVLFEKNKFKFNPLQKIILFSASFCAFVLLLLSQHLTWDAVGEGVVDLIVGRYLIPILPFILFAIGNYKVNLNIPYALVFIITLVTLYSFSAYKITDRYYIGSCIEKNVLTCDAETVNADGNFITSNPAVFLSGGATKTDFVAHSGKSSIMLSEQTPEGFKFKFNNFNPGDLIEVSLWQKGQGAQLVVMSEGNNCSNLNAQWGVIYYYDKTGWNRIQNKILMQENCRNANFVFYVKNPTKEKIYVDDLSFCIRKFKPTN